MVMIPCQTMRFFRCALVLAGATSLTGCLAPDPGNRRPDSREVSLGQAMVSSAAGSSKPLAGRNSNAHSSGYSDENEFGAVAPAAATVAGISSSDGPGDGHFQLSLVGDHLRPFNGDILGINRVTLHIGRDDDQNYFGLYLGGGDVNFRSGSLPDLAVHAPWTIDAGFIYRRYFTKPNTFISPYLTLGFAYHTFFWDYRTPVTVGGDVIDTDSVDGFGGFAGLGATIRRDEHLGFFGEIRAGQSAFLEKTSQGFRNDLLDNFTYVAITVGLSLNF